MLFHNHVIERLVQRCLTNWANFLAEYQQLPEETGSDTDRTYAEWDSANAIRSYANEHSRIPETLDESGFSLAHLPAGSSLLRD